ncbi:MAG: WYL domain-containing protein, partial [Acidimicrobiales bacterium]
RAEAPVRVTGSLGSMRGWELGDAEPIEARLRVDTDQAAWARHAAGTTGETMADGSVVLTLQVRNPDAFRSFALSFLEHGEVLDPPELRDDIVAWLRALA